MILNTPTVTLDEDGSLSVTGTLSSDKGVWAGRHLVLVPCLVSELPPPRIIIGGVDSPNPISYGIFLATDAMDAVKGNPVIGGGATVTLVWNDGTIYRVL